MPQSKNLPAKSLLGIHGENLVAQSLRNQNWTLLAKNLRFRGSEIDIIAKKEKTLIFVEVKTTRQPARFLSGVCLEELLSYKKRLALMRGASRFLSEHVKLGEFKSYRFDVALVGIKNKEDAKILRYIPNAFEFAAEDIDS